MSRNRFNIYINEFNKKFDINSIEELYVVYNDTKVNDFNNILISKNGNDKSATLLPINQIMNLLIENKIKDFYLCHNHPRSTPFFSIDDYSATKQIYIFSKILNINVINHYILCQQRGVVSFPENDTYFTCIDKDGHYQSLDNLFLSSKIDNFVQFIKSMNVQLINKIINDTDFNSRNKSLIDLANICYNENSKFDVFENISFEEFLKIGKLTEIDMKPLKVIDNQLKNTLFDGIIMDSFYKRDKFNNDKYVESDFEWAKRILKEHEAKELKSKENQFKDKKGKEIGKENDGK